MYVYIYIYIYIYIYSVTSLKGDEAEFITQKNDGKKIYMKI